CSDSTLALVFVAFFFFPSRRRHTSLVSDWSSDVCSSDLACRAASIFLALDKRTGKLLWKQSRDRAMTWSTPVVLRVGTRDELIRSEERRVGKEGRARWSPDD